MNGRNVLDSNIYLLTVCEFIFFIFFVANSIVNICHTLPHIYLDLETSSSIFFTYWSLPSQLSAPMHSACSLDLTIPEGQYVENRVLWTRPSSSRGSNSTCISSYLNIYDNPIAIPLYATDLCTTFNNYSQEFPILSSNLTVEYVADVNSSVDTDVLYPPLFLMQYTGKVNKITINFFF